VELHVCCIRFCRSLQVPLGFFNWMVPCVLRAPYQKAQVALLAMTSAESDQAMHLILLPTFSWQKGQLWMSQQLALKDLQSARVNLDGSFFVPLHDKSDQRDCRPLNLPGRIAVPMTPAQDGASYAWKACALLRKGRCEFAQQLPNKEMIEEIGSLPPVSRGSDAFSHHYGPSGSKRFEQPGVDVCLKLLDSTVDGFNVGSGLGMKGAWLLLDGHVGCGDMLQAFVMKRVTTSTPGFYFGLCESAEAADWVLAHVRERLSDLVHEKLLQLPGFSVGEDAMPEALRLQPPADVP
jgi:hypothetical protein